MKKIRITSNFRTAMCPTSEHGAISPFQWSHSGYGVRLDQVCQAIGISERIRGARWNAKRIDIMNASVRGFVDFEVNDAFDKMVI